MDFILASASPRRKELLKLAGFKFRVQPAHVDETVKKGERPAAYVRRMAKLKARQVGKKHPEQLVLAADTIVVLGSEILGKPRHRAEARQMLRRLQGRTHQVFTACCWHLGTVRHTFLVRTRVRFLAMTEKDVSDYVASGEPLDKAGAYAVQGKGAAWIASVHGSYTSVVGLPLAEIVQSLQRLRGKNK